LRIKTLFAVSALFASQAAAADLEVTLQIPRNKHRPYVAIWIERDGAPHETRDLAVWYKKSKYLRDLRQWWRTGGNMRDRPVDGVSSATRSYGEHTLKFRSDEAPLEKLPSGAYQLVVEASREKGGDEVVRLPFQWPPAKAATASASGRDELGDVTLSVRP